MHSIVLGGGVQLSQIVGRVKRHQSMILGVVSERRRQNFVLWGKSCTLESFSFGLCTTSHQSQYDVIQKQFGSIQISQDNLQGGGIVLHFWGTLESFLSGLCTSSHRSQSLHTVMLSKNNLEA